MLQQQIPPNALITVDNEYVVRGELPAAMARGAGAADHGAAGRS